MPEWQESPGFISISVISVNSFFPWKCEGFLILRIPVIHYYLFSFIIIVMASASASVLALGPWPINYIVIIIFIYYCVSIVSEHQETPGFISISAILVSFHLLLFIFNSLLRLCNLLL